MSLNIPKEAGPTVNEPLWSIERNREGKWEAVQHRNYLEGWDNEKDAVAGAKEANEWMKRTGRI
jgi:hypothetical protein